jgi:hypothetical protein
MADPRYAGAFRWAKVSREDDARRQKLPPSKRYKDLSPEPTPDTTYVVMVWNRQGAEGRTRRISWRTCVRLARAGHDVGLLRPPSMPLSIWFLYSDLFQARLREAAG